MIAMKEEELTRRNLILDDPLNDLSEPAIRVDEESQPFASQLVKEEAKPNQVAVEKNGTLLQVS